MPFASRNYHLIDDDDDELDHEVCFGEYRVGIVGIRYYNGTVNKGEMVSLNREPRNPYDKNAIRVDNVCGIQVGHIKRTVAMALASIIDRMLVRLEGTVPFGQNNMFTMPCDLTFWGKPENQDAVVQTMRRYGFIMKTYNNTGNNVVSVPGNEAYASNYSHPIPKSIKISQDQMHNELNKLFDKMEKKQEKGKLQEREPAEAIRTKLYPHQKQSLAWMTSKENNQDLPPFWTERTRNGRTEYFNSATNFATVNKPSCVKGGILADDMGLGKTLQMISLILTNFHEGKPLATLDDVGTGISKTLKQKNRRPRKNTTVSKKSSRKKGKRNKTVVSSDESSVEEVSDDDKVSVGDANDDDDGDDADDQMEDSSQVMLRKEDPDFKPVVMDTNEQPEETNVRRSGRSRKKPVRYVEYGSDEEEEGNDNDNLYAASPPKKPKRKPKSTQANKTAPLKPSAHKIVSQTQNLKDAVEADSDCQIVSPPLPSLSAITSLPPGSKGAATSHTTVTNDSTNPANKSSARPTTSQSVTGKRASLPTGVPRTTLVICPLSVLSNWENEFDTHVHPNLINIYTYYGQDRTKDKKVLEEQDVVLTTYQTLSAEYAKGKSPLKEVKWLRIILDEGHCIRNPKAQMTKAVHALNAERRWVVTGTPIQNSMKDLWSIICYLRLEPFLDRQWWVRSIERPISQGDKNALSRIQSLMHIVALRRTKTQKINGKPIVELPSREVFIQPVELSLEERNLYDSMANEGKLVIGNYVTSGTALHNYADVLAILMRLRQLCCHPGLCASAIALASASSNSGTPEELRDRLISSLMTMLSTGVDEECPICLDSLITPVITHCAHVFCRLCIENVIKSVDHQKARCPLCRGDVRKEQLVEVPETDEGNTVPDGEWKSSSKVDCLMSKLVELRSSDPTIKSIVISQFTSLLSLVEVPLNAQGFSYVRLDGSMSQARRAQVIDEFNVSTPGSPTVILLSMKAGGVGLNLTAACQVFLLDPAWNPAAEEQCFDRCHRLGQTRNVTITKFIVKDSVEEKMLDLQKKKRELMSEAFKKKTTVEERRKQRIKDLKSLMDL